MPRGWPLTYDPTDCGMVIAAMSEGKSLTAIAADVGCGRSTLGDWMARHKAFAEAVEIGRAKCPASGGFLCPTQARSDTP